MVRRRRISTRDLLFELGARLRRLEEETKLGQASVPLDARSELQHTEMVLRLLHDRMMAERDGAAAETPGMPPFPARPPWRKWSWRQQKEIPDGPQESIETLIERELRLLDGRAPAPEPSSLLAGTVVPGAAGPPAEEPPPPPVRQFRRFLRSLPFGRSSP